MNQMKRSINKYINDVQSYIFRNAKIIGYPTRICIDPTNYCQLFCPLCPTGNHKKNVKKGNLTYQNYLKLINEIGDYLYKITFYNWGEPLFNPELFLCVKDAANRGIRANISTNLNYYTDAILRDLVESNLYKLTISLDGASQDTSEVYRKNGDFQKVIAGIRKINKIKEELNTPYPILLWQYILMSHNKNEVEQAKSLAKELNMEFRLKAVSLEDDSVQQQKKWYPKNKEYQKIVHDANSRKPYIDRCIELWNSPVINWDGALFPCCHVFGDEYSMGNVFTDGFKKTWNNQKMISARKAVMHLNGEHGNTYCQVCPDRRPYRSVHEFINALSRKGTSRRNIFQDKKDMRKYENWESIARKTH